MRQALPFLVLLLAAGVALAEDKPVVGSTDDEPEPAKAGPKTLSGMSVLGNREAPKALVIVPWKSSQIGDSLGISAMLDEGRQPVDRDVFLRALSYYQIRSEGDSQPDIPARRDG
jgi:hypothetical protein